MKNIFKLGSVFMAIALLVSTLLLSSVLASAEPDWQLVGEFTLNSDYSGMDTVIVDDATLQAALAAEFDTYGVSDGDPTHDGAVLKIEADANTNYVSGGGGYACWILTDGAKQLWTNDVSPNTVYFSSTVHVNVSELNSSWVLGAAGDGGDTVIHVGTIAIYAYREAGTVETTATVAETETQAEPTATEIEPTATEIEPTATEIEPTATEIEPTETGAEPSVTEPSETEPSVTEPSETEPSVTEPSVTEPSETEPSETEPSETEPSETEPSETEPSETEPSEPVSLVETVLVENNVGGAKTLKPEKTDAWFLVVNEIKADVAKNGPIDPDKGEYYQITVTGSVDNGEADFHLGEGLDWAEYWGDSGCVTTEESTVTAIIPVAIPAEGIGDVYLADSGEAGHTLSWTYAKVSVFRVGEPTEPSVEPTATEVEPTGVDVTRGDANNDGDINMKDVLTLRKYIAGIEVEINEAAADANADGDINMKDVLLLRKFIAGIVDTI